MERIEREILIEAPVEVVWRTLTEPDQVSKWFADEVGVRPEPGESGVLVFGDPASPDAHRTRIAVLDVDAPRRFSYRWNHPEGTEPTPENSLLVEFTLVPEGESTRLQVTESGMSEQAWSTEEREQYTSDHETGWEYHLGRMREVLVGAGRQV